MSVKLATRFFEVTENVILQELNVFPRLRALVVETMVLWKTPTISWLKVTTNGSVNFHFCCEGESDSKSALSAFENHTIVA
ncbi:hypothetical protein P8452_70647 [Trifolium repens]|nr:hypothetical protein P8452_70647 [Trifolium repens]